MADTKAGDCILIVGGISTPPIEFAGPLTVPGSGKLETPPVRMHFAKASACVALFDELVLVFTELLPHPAATRQATMAPRTTRVPGRKAARKRDHIEVMWRRRGRA